MNLQPFEIAARSGGNGKTFNIAARSGGNDKTFQIAARSGGNGKTFQCRKKIDKTSFATIQSIVRAGMGKRYFEIGEEIITHYTYEGTVYDMPWVVLDNDRLCEWTDGTKHPGLWIGSKYATIEDIQFDAPEQEEATEETAQEGLFYCGRNRNTYKMLNLNTGEHVPYSSYEHVYHGIVNHKDFYYGGYNRYLHSAQRQWLNSAAGFNEWWTPQHVGDCPPSQLSQRKGFMAGLDSDFLAVINPVKIQVATNTVTDGGVTDVMYDRFFLQSIEEVYGSPQNNDVEGPYFPYWKQITGLESPSNGSYNDQNDARRIRTIDRPDERTVSVRLRSAKRNDPDDVWIIYNTAYLENNIKASTAYFALPACVIS